ncbi:MULTISPECIES: dihydrodipicolinate synthase family protein [unclassified Haladaptatus]|uniref:dihydrodipicolinate synthase family protein n=1 Tax=unclassified Haladaptatus TaxID=2622732 RepID=UPI00209BBC0F|nr:MULTISPECIES: dihydrodipicolinate synthase family protein [unclassified Haladaptatus]MCO8244822.1 dihydrodipicolinate synthase family protein [Haladaptatus sp. AB643]MCO8255666.1 dihydrodipicolinate synthase family protein [Haladaptatus sp. AB618]
MPLSNDEVRQHLRGVAAGLLTPFDDDLEVEHEKLQENARSLYDGGIRTFLASANISEYHSLSRDERVEVTRSSVDALPSDACILAGVGGSTEEAKDTIRSYDRVGVDAMMIMPPDHSYIHEQGLIRYYEKLDAVADAPLVPYVKGFDPSVEYLRDLTNVDGVVGIKYALEDAVKLGRGVEAGADDVVWVDGLAEPFALPFWNEGIEGFSAGVSNFRPEIGLALFDALTAGDWERARRIRNICVPYQNFREETGKNNTIAGAISVSAVKKGLDLAGLHGGKVREPIEPLSPADERTAEELYGQLEDDIERLIAE